MSTKRAAIPLETRLAANDLAERGHGFIYFFEAGPFVKIGFTTDWRSRLRVLQTASPYPVIALRMMHGTREDEGELHAHFDYHRCNGEWFVFHDEIREFLYRMAVEGCRLLAAEELAQ
jgi:Meiotically up-regulated gene 113